MIKENVKKIPEIRVILNMPSDAYPLSYRKNLHAYMCKIAGNNQYKQSGNLFIHSSIEGVKHITNAISPKKDENQYFSIRANDPDILMYIIENISKNRHIFNDVTVRELECMHIQYNKNYFKTRVMSPILFGRRLDRTNEKLNLSEREYAEKYLVDKINQNMVLFGLLPDNNLKIKIIRQYDRNTKVRYQNNSLYGKNLVLKIEANDLTKKFIMTHGIGRSVSLGLGFID